MWLWRHINSIPITYQGYGGHGNQIRDILDINDLCLLIKEQISKISKINNHTFNVGGGSSNALSLKELTGYCEKITKNKIKFKKKIKTSNYDLRYYVTDNKKIYSIYKWRVSKKLDTIINETFQSLNKNKKALKKLI